MRFLRIKYTAVLLAMICYFTFWLFLIVDEIADTGILSSFIDNYDDEIMIGLTTLPAISIWLCLSNMAANQLIFQKNVEQTFD